MPEARRAFFRSLPLLDGVSDASVDRMARKSESVRRRRRAALWVEQGPAREVWWIRGGVVRVLCSPDEGHEVTLGFHGRGALLGEGAGLSDAPRSTRAEAHEDCTLYATPAAEFERLLEREPVVGRRVAALLLERRRRLEARVGLLASRSARRRLASVLVELAGEFGVRDSRGIIVNLRLTHREVASLLGTTRETASLALIELRRAGLVLPDGKRLVLLDPPALDALARGASAAVEARAVSS